VQIYAALT